MSDESRNVLGVTFEDSAESIKVCVCMCVHVCGVRVCVVCVCVCVCASVCVCMCVHTCIHVCLCVVCVCVSAYMYVCVCRESREPLFLPCSFSCVRGSEGIWLITHHYCTFIVQIQFLTVKEVFEGEVQPLDQLGCGWHCKGVYICMYRIFSTKRRGY